MSGILTIILMVVAYIILSRMILMAALTLIKTPAGIINLFREDYRRVNDHGYCPSEMRWFFMWPVLGELALLVAPFVIFLYYPLSYIENCLESFRENIRIRKSKSIDKK